MARSTPQVNGARLVCQSTSAQAIIVGTPDWYNWLCRATSFAFTSDAGRFTARKEQRGRADGYWRAYRRRHGYLHSAYLGKTADLSVERLRAVACLLDEAQPSSNVVASSSSPQPIDLSTSLMNPTTQPTLSTLPNGTITFLLCAIGEADDPAPECASLALAVFQRVISEQQGVWFATNVTNLAAAFTSPIQSVYAARQLQRAFAEDQQLKSVAPSLRVVLHTGVVTAAATTYHGHVVQFAHYLLASSGASQVLLSHVTAELVRDQLAPDVYLGDLGNYIFDSMSRPERVYQLVLVGTSAVTATLRAPARRPHNLPRPLTPLVGREMDIAAVIASLQQPSVRLLTLTGPGGVGKTRLSLAVATVLRERFADGAFFVDLAAFHRPELVTQQIAQTLGVADVQAQALLPRLCDYLATRSVLLVLDNVEQVRSIAPTLVELLAAAPELKILATSRSVLRLAGEQEYPVAPLALPGAHAAKTSDALSDYPAVRLFVERARAARPDFALTVENAPTIAAICRQLDGLPLAIELAAVRCRMFSPEALLQRISRRLALLTGGAQDLPVRQQTLRATLDWSYRLLDPHSQTLLRRLAVFAGGFTLEAAEAVCAETPTERDAIVDGLADLVDQSLLQSGVAPSDAPRFTMLETLQEYAVEQLELTDEAHALHKRHAAYYCSIAERAETVLNHGVDRACLDRLNAERANFRIALRWMLDQQQFEIAARLASALTLFWDLRSARREGYDWLAAVLAHADALSLPARAKTQYAAGYIARALHERETATALFTASVVCYRELGDQPKLAQALQNLAWTHVILGGDLEQPVLWLDESLAIARAVGDLFTIGWALQCRGRIEQFRALGYTYSSNYLLESLSWVERFPGSLAQAEALHLESLAVRRADGDLHSIAWVLFGLGVVATTQRKIDVARTYQEERLAIERSIGNNYGVAETLRLLGTLAVRQGDYATARTWLIECLALADELGERFTALFALMLMGEVAHGEGDLSRAAALFDESLAGFTLMNDIRRMTRVSILRAQVALEDGDASYARTLALQSLAHAQAANDPAFVSFCMSGLADSAARVGQTRWAAQLWGVADAQIDSPNVRRLPIEPPARAQLQSQVRRALGERTWTDLWTAGRSTTPEAVLAPAAIPEAPTQNTYGLTRRELDVLRLLTEGRSNAEIAAQLVISLATVNTYLSAIYRKINVSSRTAAMRFALDHVL